MSYIVDVHEVTDVFVAIGQDAPRIGRDLAAVTRKAGQDVVGRAQRKVLVDTGHLRSTIGVDFEGDGRNGQMHADAGPTADYGPHVEFGHVQVVFGRRTGRTVAPQPYMIPALDEVAPAYIAACTAIVERVI